MPVVMSYPAKGRDARVYGLQELTTVKRVKQYALTLYVRKNGVATIYDTGERYSWADANKRLHDLSSFNMVVE